MIREFFETIGELMRVSSKTGCWCTLVPTYQVTWRRHGNSLPKTATLTSESSLSAPLSFHLYLTCFFPVTLSFSFSFHCLSSFASFCFLLPCRRSLLSLSLSFLFSVLQLYFFGLSILSLFVSSLHISCHHLYSSSFLKNISTLYQLLYSLDICNNRSG